MHRVELHHPMHLGCLYCSDNDMVIHEPVWLTIPFFPWRRVSCWKRAGIGPFLLWYGAPRRNRKQTGQGIGAQ